MSLVKSPGLNKCYTILFLVFILALTRKFLRKENLIYCRTSIAKWNERINMLKESGSWLLEFYDCFH